LVANQIVLTALHCFTEEGIDPNYFWVTLDNQQALLVAGEAAPNELDVVLMVMHQPFSVHGSTTGYSRPLVDGSAGQPVFAVGYGWSATSPVFSDVCKSQTKGCFDDPRQLLVSTHSTLWDPARSNTGTELYVQANSSGQQPYEGDSGGPLLTLSIAANELSTRPLMGVLARRFDDSSHAYTPVQHFRSWYCGIMGC
jgi:secreted trypsin-like serine protease